MAVYAIGDIQGCYTPLRHLLDKLDFDPANDTLWLTGDLVNRGPESLETLRFVRSLGEQAVSVLGNHDLHLIARHLNARHKPGKRDTLDATLKADDRDELIDWLQRRPILHHDPSLNAVMVHAGIPSHWNLKAAKRQARKLDTLLQGPQARKLLKHSYRFTPHKWSHSLSKWEKRCYALGAFTRMRYIYPNGKLEMAHKGAPGSQRRDTLPWFDARHARWRGEARVIFGHWATLGIHQNDHVIGLDGGCVWGGTLVAAQIDIEPARMTEVLCQVG
ncbi:MAG: symmetrical bis(5'-nucleosyl)-tetraphosphatase [Pseudomonadota bacterium]